MDNIEKFYGRKVKFLIFGIVLILCMLVFLFIMGKGSCDQCKIRFINMEISGMKLDQPITLEVPVSDLYNGLLNNQCVIKFSRVDGYYQ